RRPCRLQRLLEGLLAGRGLLVLGCERVALELRRGQLVGEPSQLILQVRHPTLDGFLFLVADPGTGALLPKLALQLRPLLLGGAGWVAAGGLPGLEGGEATGGLMVRRLERGDPLERRLTLGDEEPPVGLEPVDCRLRGLRALLGRLQRSLRLICPRQR